MHGHTVEPELFERGRHQYGQEDVASRGRQSETEHEAGEGAHPEQQECVVTGNAQEIVGEA